MAVELFVTKDDKLVINEVAPRTHNSGHHSIESIVTSQFEQQLRAVLGFPLGSTELRSPDIMLNLLGEPGHDGKVKYEGLEECMAIEGVNVHIYGKKETRPFRKMGHVTIIDKDIEAAKEKAAIVKNKLKVLAWKNH